MSFPSCWVALWRDISWAALWGQRQSPDGHAQATSAGRQPCRKQLQLSELQLCRVCAFFLPFSWELRDSVNMNAGHIKKEKEKKKAFPVQRPNRSPIDSASVKNIWQKNTTLFQIKTTWIPKGVTITLKNPGQFQSHYQLFEWNVCYLSGTGARTEGQNRLNSGKTQDSFLEFPEHDLVQALVGPCFLVEGSKAITSQQ